MNNDIKTLTKYPEYYALKKLLLDHIQGLRNEVDALDVKDPSFAFQVGVKIQSVNDLKGFLLKLGAVERSDFEKKRQTYE